MAEHGSEPETIDMTNPPPIDVTATWGPASEGNLITLRRCPECVKEGRRSRVWVGNSRATAAYSPPFYDEEGRYHHHDPNSYTTEYECSNGHRWTETIRHKCWCEQPAADPPSET